MISAYSFGKMNINGTWYMHDLRINGETILPDWWRRSGHVCDIEDIKVLLVDTPDVLIIRPGHARYDASHARIAAVSSPAGHHAHPTAYCQSRGNIQRHVQTEKHCCRVSPDLLKTPMTVDTLTLEIDKTLRTLLSRKYRNEQKITYPLTRRASIKDIIEALHIPHTEVRAIFLQTTEITFQHIPKGGERLSLFSFSPGTDITRPTLLRPEPLPKAVFMVDINVGKLARLLRMSGIDTWYEPRLNEVDLAEQAAKSKRILLSRNRDLLQRKIITWGHLVLAEQPEEQLAEVITLFNLANAINPFSRCLRMQHPPAARGKIHHSPSPEAPDQKILPKVPNLFCLRSNLLAGIHSQHMDDTMQQIQSKLN